MLQINRLACENKWDEVLKKADVKVVRQKQVLSQVDRALFHKGILLNYMFYYPQSFRHESLIIQGPAEASMAMPLSDIYFDMGFINESRHWANEALTVLGKQPEILKRLAVTYIITGQYRTAEKYLNILRSSVITRSWAEKYSKYLYCDDCVKQDRVLGRLRKMNPATDFFASIQNPYDNIRQLVIDSLAVPMAFEYYIAYKLLMQKPGEVIGCLGRFRSMGYEKLPLACQEAILIYKATRGITTYDDLEGYTIDKAIEKKFNDFSAILFGRFKGDINAARNSLIPFSQTYWYYYLYSRPMKPLENNSGSYSNKY